MFLCHEIGAQASSLPVEKDTLWDDRSSPLLLLPLNDYTMNSRPVAAADPLALDAVLKLDPGIHIGPALSLCASRCAHCQGVSGRVHAEIESTFIARGERRGYY